MMSLIKKILGEYSEYEKPNYKYLILGTTFSSTLMVTLVILYDFMINTLQFMGTELTLGLQCALFIFQGVIFTLILSTFALFVISGNWLATFKYKNLVNFVLHVAVLSPLIYYIWMGVSAWNV